MIWSAMVTKSEVFGYDAHFYDGVKWKVTGFDTESQANIWIRSRIAELFK